jgi:tripartite-type tricarboxylate transporter receptor subunit TctC
MMRFCRSLAWIAAAFALFAFGVAAAQAQTAYPDHPVKIIVPIGPGGSYDLIGRHIADVLSKRTGQAFFVENKPGAGTVVGTQVAAQSEPDGYTLVVGGLSNMAFNSALYSRLGYEPLRDFVPVALVYRFGYVMVGRKDMPQKTLQDIVAAAKANPGSITVATAGVGTGQQLVAAAFMKVAGVKLLEVPYKGSPPAFTDLLAGRIDLFFDSIAAGLPYVQSGQARGIAVLSSKRSLLAPDVPTMAEAGLLLHRCPNAQNPTCTLFSDCLCRMGAFDSSQRRFRYFAFLCAMQMRLCWRISWRKQQLPIWNGDTWLSKKK